MRAHAVELFPFFAVHSSYAVALAAVASSHAASGRLPFHGKRLSAGPADDTTSQGVYFVSPTRWRP